MGWVADPVNAGAPVRPRLAHAGARGSPGGPQRGGPTSGDLGVSPSQAQVKPEESPSRRRGRTPQIWQRGHQKVERCCWRIARTGVAQTRQGSPVRS